MLVASGASFERLARTAKPLVGAAWMREVYGLYRAFGLTDDATALDPLLAELGERSKQDLVRTTYSTEIPREAFDSIARAVMSEDLGESIDRVAEYFLVDPENAERDVERIAKVAPLLARVRHVHLDARGRPESEIGSIDEDLDGRIVDQMRQAIGFDAIFLRHALQAVIAHFSVTAGALSGHLFHSPVFEASQHALIERAVRAYLESDWATFSHLVVPQIEEAVRVLVVKLGGSHLALRRGGGMNLRPLDDLLRDSKVVTVLGSRVVRYLQVVLVDQRGLNLRNAICHGFLPSDQFGPQMADRLLHVVLVLAQLRSASPEGDTNPGSPTA